MTFSPDGTHLFSGGLDKVVHVWDFPAGVPRLKQTIRPPINRKGGWIYALALSPAVGAQQQRLMAIAGHGVSAPAGDILIYRFPGLKDPGTGDLAIHLPSDSMVKPLDQRQGHADVVLGLEFSPNGRYLASCGKDKTIRIWDLGVPDHPTLAVLTGHAGEVVSVVFRSNEQIISSGGYGDGTLRVWNWKLRQPLVTTFSPIEEDLEAPLGVRVNALALSPDGRHVAIGRENGKLERYDTMNLTHRSSSYLNPEEMNQRRSVEALAYSPDGKFLATSILKYPHEANRYNAQRTECEIAIRSMPEGRPTKVVMTTAGLVRALAFRPDGRFLAIGGGDDQAIVLRHLLASADQPVLELKGPGTALWNVAFADNRPTVAYAKQRPIAPAGWTWDGFDLSERRFVPVTNPDRLQRAITTSRGWTIEPDPAHPLLGLNAVSAEGPRVPISMDRNEDLGWTSFSLLPPNPEVRHPSLAVAVGTRGGSIVIHRLPDGQKTRVFMGHAGAVHGLAPSADGRWLVSASADQTVRLWSLAGCDTRPPLGVTWDRNAQGVFTVKDVAPRGFAQEMGLQPGDRIDQCTLSRDELVPIAPDLLIRQIDTIAPGTPIAIAVRRGGRLEQFQTTRRDSPVLNLIPGSDREWVIWTPEGYYDSSIAGDRRLLAWQFNTGLAAPAKFFPMSRYDAQLRRPRVIDERLKTADAAGAIDAAAPPMVVAPPSIRIVEPAAAAGGDEVTVQQPTLVVRVEAVGSQDRLIGSIVVRNGSARNPPRIFDPALPRVEVTQEIKLQPEGNPITIVATDNRGVEGIQTLRIRLNLPKPPMSIGPRLVVRSIGIEKFRGRDIPAIPFAALDAHKLANFLVAPTASTRFHDDRIDAKVIDGAGANSEVILDVFERLSAEIREHKLRAGDTVFLAIQSHVLNLGPGGSLVLGDDAESGERIAETSVPAQAISERLEEVASAGCLVLLLLDGIHAGMHVPVRSPVLTEWVRDLNKRGVIVLLASKQNPSERLSQSGVFTQAILDSSAEWFPQEALEQEQFAFTPAIRDSMAVARRVARPGNLDGGTSPTLDDFQASVVNRVRELTGGRQFADFFPPEYPNWSDIRIFEPQPAPWENLTKR
jgi:WD40 repeat protein